MSGLEPKPALFQLVGFRQSGGLGILTLEVGLCQPPGLVLSVAHGGVVMGGGESPELFQVPTLSWRQLKVQGELRGTWGTMASRARVAILLHWWPGWGGVDEEGPRPV